MALLTAAEAASYVPQLGNVESAQLDLLLEVASNQIESLCNRKFQSSDHHEKQTGDGGSETFISNPPILRFDSVELFGTDGSKYLNSGLEFGFVSDIGHVRFNATQSTGSQFSDFEAGDLLNVVLNYRGGYETLPHDLKYLIAWWAYAMYQESLKTAGLKSESLQEYSYTNGELTDNLPPRIREILNKYRIINPM